GNVEPRVGGVRHHAARVDPDVDGAEDDRGVAMGSGDVEDLDLVEVLVAEIGPRTGAVELDLGLHPEPARGTERRPRHPRALRIGLGVDERERVVEAVDDPGARHATAEVEDLHVEGIVTDGDTLDPGPPRVQVDELAGAGLVDPELVELLRGDVELCRARPAPDPDTVGGARALAGFIPPAPPPAHPRPGGV